MATTARRLDTITSPQAFGSLLLLIGFFLPWFNVAPLLDDPDFILEAAGPASAIILPQGLEGDVRVGLNNRAEEFGLPTPIPEQFTPQQIIAFAQDVEGAINNPPPLVRIALIAAGQAPQVPERAWALNILWIIPVLAGICLVLCAIGRRPRVTPVPAALLAVFVVVGVWVSGATYEGPTGEPVLGWDRMLAVQGMGAWLSLLGGLAIIVGALRKGLTDSA